MRKAFKSDDCSPLTAAVKRGEVSLVAHSRGQYPGKHLSDDKLPGLRTIGYWDAVGPQSWGLPMHRNEGIEICYLLSGQTSFSTDTGEWLLHAGDITITRPWQRHSLGNPNIEACKLFWIILDVESSDARTQWEFPKWVGPDAHSRRELLRIFRQNQCCHLVDKGSQLKGFMQHTFEKITDDGPLATAYLANAINYLLLSVAQRLSEGIEQAGKDPQGFNQTIRQFFQGLEASIEKAADPWTVDTMAHACRVGKSYLTTSCREIFNSTPSEQLNLIRLFHASKLLTADPDRSVTQVAFETGFNSSQYFANRFKKHFGMTPQTYRAEHQ
ncbi:AraC family transcriptional regulator [Rubellicoccus peritrichatus]|uniref:AraC family transcriptional regulator n=1 Tax=Rubellicoccus peritrichatus TaxID=3080537 RepID=A0AAQ3QYE7_9BACT|nr:AraC family transcriptional regulator [Puniceicoccus sp. CR14]WOO43725.1 AraC family transcriptional regulator [Puniceicoccus sp. CR14]